MVKKRFHKLIGHRFGRFEVVPRTPVSTHAFPKCDCATIKCYCGYIRKSIHFPVFMEGAEIKCSKCRYTYIVTQDDSLLVGKTRREDDELIKEDREREKKDYLKNVIFPKIESVKTIQKLKDIWDKHDGYQEWEDFATKVLDKKHELEKIVPW